MTFVSCSKSPERWAKQVLDAVEVGDWHLASRRLRNIRAANKRLRRARLSEDIDLMDTLVSAVLRRPERLTREVATGIMRHLSQR